MKPVGQKVVADHEVVSLEFPAPGHCVIHLKASFDLPEILPGNFAEILPYHSPDTFLRRPFSVFDVDYANRKISFYIKVIGKGTKRLSELRQGEQVNIIYPLGNSFTLPVRGSNVLVVAGGSGIAPFLLLGKTLFNEEITIDFLFGARTAQDVVLSERFGQYGKVYVTTEDGSIGHKGLVTDHPLMQSGLHSFDRIYTCGPDPMMKAVDILASGADIPCQASLENTMACGFGVCLSCVTQTIAGNKCVCTDGPVFDTNYLRWRN